MRTIGIAAAATVTDALLAFPIAFYMAKVACPRVKGLPGGGGPDAALVLLPGQGLRLADDARRRTASSTGRSIPFGVKRPGYGTTAVWLVESYLWLPYMILPIYAGLERIPNSLLSASEDLGAKPLRTFRRVILPLAFPAVVAGSIFTFSLTLGDYITPSLVSPDTQFIGNVVFSQHTNNLPLASAFAMVPIVVMVIYLLIAQAARSVRAPMSASRAEHSGTCCGSAVAITPRVHLHPADRDRDLRLQRRHTR